MRQQKYISILRVGILLFFLCPLKSFSQDISGVWVGYMYNDTTHQTIHYELAINDVNGKTSGFSHTTFVFNDVKNIGVKEVKVKEKNDKVYVEDEKFVYDNYTEPPAKGVKMFSFLTLSKNDSSWVLSGIWRTNATKQYNPLTGSIFLQKKKSIAPEQTIIVKKLIDLGLASQLAFLPPSLVLHNDVAVNNKVNQSNSTAPSATKNSEKEKVNATGANNTESNKQAVALNEKNVSKNVPSSSATQNSLKEEANATVTNKAENNNQAVALNKTNDSVKNVASSSGMTSPPAEIKNDSAGNNNLADGSQAKNKVPGENNAIINQTIAGARPTEKEDSTKSVAINQPSKNSKSIVPSGSEAPKNAVKNNDLKNTDAKQQAGSNLALSPASALNKQESSRVETNNKPSDQSAAAKPGRENLTAGKSSEPVSPGKTAQQNDRPNSNAADQNISDKSLTSTDANKKAPEAKELAANQKINSTESKAVADNKPAPVVKAPANKNETIAANEKGNSNVAKQLKTDNDSPAKKETITNANNADEPAISIAKVNPQPQLNINPLENQQNPNALKPAVVVKPKVIVPPAAAELAKRQLETIRTVDIVQDSLVFSLYDNGAVDGDTVSVLVNNNVIMPRVGLLTTAISKTVYLTPEMGDSISVVMYAENLGSIPPNTGLLVIHDGPKIYEIRFSGDLSKNSKIILVRKKKT